MREAIKDVIHLMREAIKDVVHLMREALKDVVHLMREAIKDVVHLMREAIKECGFTPRPARAAAARPRCDLRRSGWRHPARARCARARLWGR